MEMVVVDCGKWLNMRVCSSTDTLIAGCDLVHEVKEMVELPGKEYRGLRT